MYVMHPSLPPLMGKEPKKDTSTQFTPKDHCVDADAMTLNENVIGRTDLLALSHLAETTFPGIFCPQSFKISRRCVIQPSQLHHQMT